MNEHQISPEDSRMLDSSIAAKVEVTSNADRRAYTPEEVARLLGLHPNSVYTLLKSGDLPGIKAGRKWLISKRRFEAWLDGGNG
jgi:excisionase family DNA binding protein